MGSFTEGVLSFTFREDVPEYVLAAFSSLAAPQLYPDYVDPAPPLPPSHQELDEWWTPEEEAEEFDYDDSPSDLPGFGDDARSSENNGSQSSDGVRVPPWQHDWGKWLSQAMGAATIPSGTLVWNSSWQLTCRFSWKTMPQAAFEVIRWLGPYVQTWDDDGQPARRVLIGQVQHEYAPRPHLIWARAGRLELENLNANDDWEYGRAHIPRLTVLVGLPGSGVSRRLDELASEGVHCVDDFHAEAIDHDPHPCHSRHFGPLVRVLLAGGSAAVTDRAFCDPDVRRRLKAVLDSTVAGVEYEVVRYANDLETCEANLRRRAERDADRDLDYDLESLQRFAALYRPGAGSVPVQREA